MGEKFGGIWVLVGKTRGQTQTTHMHIMRARDFVYIEAFLARLKSRSYISTKFSCL